MPFPSPMHESESEVAQSCPTLSNLMNYSIPGSSVHGIFQAIVLEWVAIAFSKFRGSISSQILGVSSLPNVNITFIVNFISNLNAAADLTGGAGWRPEVWRTLLLVIESISPSFHIIVPPRL